MSFADGSSEYEGKHFQRLISLENIAFLCFDRRNLFIVCLKCLLS